MNGMLWVVGVLVTLLAGAYLTLEIIISPRALIPLGLVGGFIVAIGIAKMRGKA